MNPYLRKSAKECLGNPMFEGIKVKEMEKSVKTKIKLLVDQDDSFDYTLGVPLKFKIKDYLNMLQNDIDEVHYNRLIQIEAILKNEDQEPRM